MTHQKKKHIFVFKKKCVLDAGSKSSKNVLDAASKARKKEILMDAGQKTFWMRDLWMMSKNILDAGSKMLPLMY